MSTSTGNRVLVVSQHDFERLLAMPGSLEGHFDVRDESGVVVFGSQADAQAARREL